MQAQKMHFTKSKNAPSLKLSCMHRICTLQKVQKMHTTTLLKSLSRLSQDIFFPYWSRWAHPVPYTALLKPTGTRSPHREYSFDHRALLAKRTSVAELHVTITIRKTVTGRPPPPGHCMDKRLKYISVFLWKAFFLFPERFFFLRLFI